MDKIRNHSTILFYVSVFHRKLEFFTKKIYFKVDYVGYPLKIKENIEIQTIFAMYA